MKKHPVASKKGQICTKKKQLTNDFSSVIILS